MIANCTVTIETYDRRWSKVTSKKTRSPAIISCYVGRTASDYTISVKTKASSTNGDLYVTQKLQVYDKCRQEGKLTIKIPEFFSILLISDTTEDVIQCFLDAARAGVPAIAESGNKENESKNKSSSESTTLSRTPSKLRKGGGDSNNPSSPSGGHKLQKTPVKRHLNIATPSKLVLPGGMVLTPQSRHKQPRLKVTSPAIRFQHKTSPPSGRKTHRNRPSTPADSTATATNSSLTDEQEAVVAAALRGDSLFFSGEAGTGKSSLLLRLIEQLVQKHGQHAVFVTATTGLSACAIGGMTIHQFAGITVSSGDAEGFDGDSSSRDEMARNALQKPHIVRRVRQARVLIVDEVSMMSPTFLETLNAMAQGARGSNSPMGGLQVVLTGDFFQLPPVTKMSFNVGGHGYSNGQCQGRGANWPADICTQNVHNTHNGAGGPTGPSRSQSGPPISLTQAHGAGPLALSTTQVHPPHAPHCFSFTQPSVRENAPHHPPNHLTRRFCFQATAWGQIIKKTHTFMLSRVFRQSDPEFVALLNSVRWGLVTDDVNRALRECVGRRFDCSDGILPTRIYTHRKDVDNLNTKELAALSGEVSEYRATDTGDATFLRVLQAHCPARTLLKLKIGAQVILVKSVDAREGMVNGAKGVIVRFTRDTRRPVVRFTDGVERTVMNETFTITSAGRVVAQRVQLPLDLAWGLSVHKSQGMTVDRTILHLKKVFEYGQAYVALSRVRSKSGLSIDSALSPATVRAHPDVVAFYQDFLRPNKEEGE